MSRPVPDGFREVRCPLLELEGAHRVFIAGRTGAPRLVMMQPGYPDTQETFAPLGRRLAAEADCLVALTCMPEYDTLADGRPLLRKSGYTLDETALCLAQAIAVLRAESSTPGAELILVLHDFGVPTGLIYTNRALQGPDGPARVVCLDVLVKPQVEAESALSLIPGNTVRERVIHLIYRSLFATSYLLSCLSATLAAVYFSLGAIFCFGLLGRWLSPTGPLDSEPGKGGTVESPKALARMAYPYYQVFKEMIWPGAVRNEMQLPPLSRCPVLYLWGEEKNTMFHTAEAVALLNSTKGCLAAPVSGAAHFLHRQQPDAVWARVCPFVLGGGRPLI